MSPRTLTAVAGAELRVPDGERLVHMQFRRFAGCPVCDLHLRSFVKRHEAVAEAGIREVVVFHSTPDDVRVHASHLPFDVIADPRKQLYAEFGVESGKRALLDPRAWGPIARAIGTSLVAIVAASRRAPGLDPLGGRFGLPADFLIASSGHILACRYGEHAYDQWSVDEVLGLARADSSNLSQAADFAGRRTAPGPIA